MKKITPLRLLSGVPALWLTLALYLSACGPAAEGSLPVRTVTDPMGNTVQLSRPIERIISAAPSNTEIIVDLGAGDRLIAVDKYSVNIPGVNRSLPAIDFMYPDGEAIIALKPDLIIASEHNRVAGEDPFKLLRDMGIAVAYIPTGGGIEEIYRDIAFIADLLEVPGRGEELTAAMKEAVRGIARTGSGIKEKKTVYFEISPPPYLVSFGRGTFLHEMLEIIGAENIFAGTTGWIAPGAEAIAAANPDVILTNTVLPGGENPVDELLRRPGFGGIRAVRNKAVYRIDTDASSRPTHHIVRALQEMARSVYPEYYE
ncbi:MAG: ABC transporter substrate-binding protein [Treponema sp.]|nr:ABC transporter substrate-binding protein [Treponema sp.]